MAILRGKAAEEFIKNNPRMVKSVIGGTSQAPVGQQELGGLLGVLKSAFVDPFARLGEGVNAATTGALNKYFGDNIEAGELTTPILGQKKVNEIQANPLGQGVGKGVAGIASLGIPAGGGLLKGAAKGALAGGLSGYGASEEGQEAKSAGIGALTGGAVGGLLGLLTGAPKAAGAGSKVNQAGYKMRAKSIGLDANKLTKTRGSRISSATEGQKAINQYLDDMDDLGINTSTSELASEGADKALSVYAERLKGPGGVLSQADNAITFTGKDTTNLANEIRNSFQNNQKVLESSTFKELMGDLNALGDAYTPSQLNAVREKARNLINWNAKAPASTQRGLSRFFEVVDDFFKKQVPEAADILSRERNIYTIRPALQSKAITSGSVKVGTASTNLSVPTGGIQERVGTTVGTALQKGLPTPQLGDDLVSRLKAIGQGTIPVAGAVAGDVGAMGEPTSEQSVDSGISSQGGMSVDMAALANLVFGGQISASDAKFVMELLGGGSQPKKMTQQQANATSALQSLDAMEGMLSSDPNALAMSYLPFQGFNPNAQTLEVASSNVEDVIARMRTGAVINDEEARRYRKMIPRITDTAETRLYKLQQLRQIFNNIAQKSQQTDVGALNELLGL